MSQEKIPILLGWHINETNLKFQFTAFEGSFQVKCPHISCRPLRIIPIGLSL